MSGFITFVKKIPLSIIMLNLLGLVSDALFTAVAIIYSTMPFNIVVYAALRLIFTIVSCISHIVVQVKSSTQSSVGG